MCVFIKPSSNSFLNDFQCETEVCSHFTSKSGLSSWAMTKHICDIKCVYSFNPPFFPLNSPASFLLARSSHCNRTWKLVIFVPWAQNAQARSQMCEQWIIEFPLTPPFSLCFFLSISPPLSLFLESVQHQQKFPTITKASEVLWIKMCLLKWVDST